MKKKILALVCAMTMALGMSLSVCAAGSSTAEEVVPASQEVLTTAAASTNTTGQVLTGATIEEFATTTTVSGVAGAKIEAVSNETAKAMIEAANNIVGNGAFVASVVELSVPAGTGTATFTVGCPNVWKGQSVTILHQKSDGTFEAITPSVVADNAVTFTMTSYSPIAIVVNTAVSGSITSPKTGEIIVLVAGLAALCCAGAVCFGRKARA